MIEFACGKCGQRLRCRQSLSGKKGRCPKCRTVLLIPEFPQAVEPPKEQVAAVRSNQPDTAEEKGGFLNPRYDEMTLFVMSIAFVVLFILDKTMRSDLGRIISELWSDRNYRSRDLESKYVTVVFVFLFLAGAILSFFHALSSKKKNFAEKTAMLFFAVLVNAGVGIYAGKYMLEEAESCWLMIFPIWNVIYSGLLLIKFTHVLRNYMRVLELGDVSYISDKDATIVHIVVGLVSVAVIVGVCEFAFGLYWAITYSICIVWASSFNRAAESVFGGR